MKFKTRKEMAEHLNVGPGDTWKLNETTYPFIDSKVRLIVKILNKSGIKTYSSCQGHPRRDEQQSHAYIVYSMNRCVNRAFRDAGFRVKKQDIYHGKSMKKVKGNTYVAEIISKYDKKKYEEGWKKALENLENCFENY